MEVGLDAGSKGKSAKVSKKLIGTILLFVVLGVIGFIFAMITEMFRGKTVNLGRRKKTRENTGGFSNTGGLCGQPEGRMTLKAAAKMVLRKKRANTWAFVRENLSTLKEEAEEE